LILIEVRERVKNRSGPWQATPLAHDGKRPAQAGLSSGIESASGGFHDRAAVQATPAPRAASWIVLGPVSGNFTAPGHVRFEITVSAWGGGLARIYQGVTAWIPASGVWG
jgi:hypothetical protein